MYCTYMAYMDKHLAHVFSYCTLSGGEERVGLGGKERGEVERI